jgi:hypothetical protein
MPDPVTRAKHYRERAEKFRKLADVARTPQTRAEYEKFAAYYDGLAKTELMLAKIRSTKEAD